MANRVSVRGLVRSTARYLLKKLVPYVALLAVTPALAEDGRRPIDVSVIVGRRLPAVVQHPIDTELPGEAFVVATLPYPGEASHGTAICPYQAVGAASPRVRLRCTRLLPQGYQSLRIEAEFYHEDGLIGVPAFRAANGAHFTNHGGQAGTLHVVRVLGVER